ncbi:aldo/keto reductase [Paenibacillus polymyxa]|uniref:aldo/keto reductase n=1 Tax=Paenibacillus polymyxa TaxID=1406 RepID=UPI000F9AF3E6
MEFRRVGSSGLKVSSIGLGTWINFSSVEDHVPLIKLAMEQGIFHFDTADLYGAIPGWSEELLGKSLKGIRRSSYVLATKVFTKVGEMPNDQGLSRKHIMESCERSLKRLQTDYIDIYYCHRFDENTPLYETMDAMATLKNQGKIHYVGISMWEAEQIRQFCTLAKEFKVQVIANQLLYNVIQRPNQKILDTCKEFGVGLIPYSPLAQGLLTGKYADDIPSGSRGATSHRNKWLHRLMDNPQVMGALHEYLSICKREDILPSAAAYRWLLAQDNVAGTVSGFSHPQQLEEIIQLQELTIPDRVLEELDEILFTTI